MHAWGWVYDNAKMEERNKSENYTDLHVGKSTGFGPSKLSDSISELIITKMESNMCVYV